MYELYTISKGINACFECHPCFEACPLYRRLFCAGGDDGVDGDHRLQKIIHDLLHVSDMSPRYAIEINRTLGPVFSPICLMSSSCLSVAFCASSSAFLLPLVCCSLSADVQHPLLSVSSNPTRKREEHCKDICSAFVVIYLGLERLELRLLL